MPNIMGNGYADNDPKKNSGNNPSLNDDLDKIYDKILLPLLLLLFYNVNDIQLNILIINLIFKCFTQRSRLIQSLKHVQILFEEKDQLLFDHISSKVLQLKFMCEQSEVWLHTSIIKLPTFLNYNYKFAIYRVIDILKELIDLFYGSIEIENQNIYLNENKHDLSDLDPLRQIMMRNLNVHVIILKLLRDGSYVFEDLVECTEDNKLVIQVFQLCYEFLLKFCLRDNKENKKILHKEIDLFINHLNFFEVGQTALVNEIYHNNYKISVNVQVNYLSAYMDKITNKDGKGGHNPIYLDFFDSIMYEKNQPIKENCLKIISFVFDSCKKYEFLFMKENPYYQMDLPEDESSKPLLLKKQFGHYVFNLNLNDMDTNDVPYLYHARVLKILYNLIMTSSDKQLIKMILQKTLNLNYMLYLLTLDDIYFNKGPKEYLLTILHIPLLKLMNEIWLNSEKPPSSIFNNPFVLRFINKHIMLLRNLTKSDMEQVIHARRTSVFKQSNMKDQPMKKKSSEVFIFDKTEDSNQTRLEYEEGEEPILNDIISKHCNDQTFDYIDTLISDIIPIILSLNSLLVLNEKNAEELNSRDDLKALKEFAETFTNFYKKNLSPADIFRKKENLKILQEFQRTFDISGLEFVEKEDPNEKFEDLEKEIEDEIELPLKNILTNRKWSKNPHRNSYWKIFILNVLISPHIKDLITQEKAALLDAIINIEALNYPASLKDKMKKQVNLEGFIKKLVNFIKNGYGKEEGINATIVNQVMCLLKDILDYCTDPTQKAKMQNLMNKCGLIKTLLYFVCDKNINRLVYKNVVKLCISLLDGGNVECQNAFYDYFINNNSSEVLFSGVVEAINKHLSFNVQNNTLHEIMDYYMKDIVYCYKNPNFTLNDLLKFLQLMTENHNVNLQVNYLF